MEVDIRKHEEVRKSVWAGLVALKVQARQIWGDDKLSSPDIAVRLMVTVGDIARLARDYPWLGLALPDHDGYRGDAVKSLKKELGNVLFSTIRWIDDLGLDVLECIDLAIEAQEKFAKSGRPR